MVWRLPHIHARSCSSLIVQELEDEELVALASLQLGRVLSLQGQYGLVEGLLIPIIPVLERTANWPA
jgi:hypothetical protein